MTAELVSPSHRRTTWGGRASHLRRHQVQSRHVGTAARVSTLWASVVEVLGAVPGSCGAALCTADGTSVATFGLSRGEQLRVPSEARRIIGATAYGASRDDATRVVTAEVTAGTRFTVVARVPSPEHGDHLLLVTADGVSAPLLHAWTAHAAEDLHEILSDATA